MLWEGALWARMQEEGDTTMLQKVEGTWLTQDLWLMQVASQCMLACTNFGIIVAIFLQLGWLKLGHVIICVKICF